MPAKRGEAQRAVMAISTGTIIRVVILLLALGFLWYIRGILALLFISILLASIINPLAGWFEKKGLGRAVSVILLYLAIIGAVTLLFVSLIPAVINETHDLIGNADQIWSSILGTLGPFREYVASGGLSDTLTQYLTTGGGGFTSAAGRLVATARGIVGGVVSMLVVFVVTYYLVVSEESVRRLFKTVAPAPYQPYLTDLFSRIEKGVGAWMRGMLALSLIISLAVYVSLTILGVKYALLLAVTAGVAEFLPYLGPVLAAVPAVLIAITQSPFLALLTLIVYVVIHQIENHVLVPKVMQKATGLHPIVSIFALLIGVKIAGLVGALLAIPVATVLRVIISDLFKTYKSYR